MKRYFRIALTVLSMLAAMLIAAAITMRVALHAGEVTVPDLASLSVAEASEAALRAGLDLNIENRYYSTTIPAGRILSQSPAADSRVRKDWQVRVTESLGPQQVTIPDVSGQPVREASMNLRRNQLDLGAMAHLDAPGDPDIVLAQTPPPDAGVDQPRVSLLLSSAGSGASSAFLMPSFVGMSSAQAGHAAATLGLRVTAVGQTTVTASSPMATISAVPGPPAAASPTGSDTTAPAYGPSGPVLAQSPDSGFRANKGDTVRLTYASVTVAPPPPALPAPTSPAVTPTGNAAPAAAIARPVTTPSSATTPASRAAANAFAVPSAPPSPGKSSTQH